MSQDVRLGDGPVNVRDDDGVRVVPQEDMASAAREKNLFVRRKVYSYHMLSYQGKANNGLQALQLHGFPR